MDMTESGNLFVELHVPVTLHKFIHLYTAKQNSTCFYTAKRSLSYKLELESGVEAAGLKYSRSLNVKLRI